LKKSFFKDISLPSRIKNVSSAYWLNNVSSSLIVIPWISGFLFNFKDNNSTPIINR
jgi:hypothetical protein